MVLHATESIKIHGLKTAATVWVTAALGLACALAAWPLVFAGVMLTLLILFGLGWLEANYWLLSPLSP